MANFDDLEFDFENFDEPKKKPQLFLGKKEDSGIKGWLGKPVRSPWGVGDFVTWREAGFVPKGKKPTDPYVDPSTGFGQRKPFFEPRGLMLARSGVGAAYLLTLGKQGIDALTQWRTLRGVKPIPQPARVLGDLVKRGYTKSQAGAINKVKDAVTSLTKKGVSEGEALYSLAKTKKVSFADINLYKGATGEGVAFGAGLPVPKPIPLHLIKRFGLTPEQVTNIQQGIMTNIPPQLAEVLRKEGVTPTKPLKPTKAPEIKPSVKPLFKPSLVSAKQIKQAHVIAKGKAFLSPTGKVKPQYRRLAQGITGKKSMKDMTEEEAHDFILSLQKISKPVFKGGKLVPPTIPKTTAVVPEGFFKRKFKTPTPLAELTSQQFYATQLGVGELTRPLEIARQNIDLETRAMENAIDQQVNLLNKIEGLSFNERILTKVKNIPTKSVEEMRDLLDTFEEAPPQLAPEKKAVFNWFRNLTRSMLKGQNEVRAKLDLPLIKTRQAYVRHVADSMAKEMLQGKYPFPEGLKYWSQRLVGKKIFNPMELQRQLSSDLEGYFTKDLAFAMKSMIRTAFKEIHLSAPLRAFSEQLGALSKDMPIYEDLTPEELQGLREVSVMPASTKKWLIEYVNQVIKGQQTHLDESVNKLVIDSGLGGIFNKALKPFGRAISQKPVTHFFSFIGKNILRAVIPARLRLVIRNKFQLFQNLGLYTIKANLKGFMPASVDKNLEDIISNSIFFKSYTGIEETPRDVLALLDKVGFAPYQWSAITNAGQAMKTAYWDTLDLIVKPKFKKFGWADPKRTYTEPKDFLYPSEKEKLIREMEFGAGVTQYTYIPLGMPGVFRHKVLVPATRLQSWWMNYFTKFTREAVYRGIKGETSYGAKLPWSRRLGYLKYLLIAGAIFAKLGYKKSFLLGVLPTFLSPMAQFALGLYTFVAADRPQEKAQAVYRMKSSWRAFIPGSLAWKDFSDVWSGRKPLKSLFLYTPSEKGRREVGDLDFESLDFEGMDFDFEGF